MPVGYYVRENKLTTPTSYSCQTSAEDVLGMRLLPSTRTRSAEYWKKLHGVLLYGNMMIIAEAA
jgi:hypothetical protein